ncbi:hypothetical protein NA78x_004393 [Anatilimnocola sp. NA78]|uniref:hypothetical protein n=1 Tax=Anatilimnocola sp. NA78 TaxID=3415683 RepID=UPI003CE515AE
MGKVTQRAAEGIKYRVEQLLETQNLNQPMGPDLAQWVNGLELGLAKKLAKLGLIPNPERQAEVAVGDYLHSWIDARKGDYKKASVISWGQVKVAIGAKTLVSKVTRQVT